MKKELLSLTDENSILITAEFIESGRRLLFGGEKTRRIEFDFVVNKKIKFEELMVAIKKGIENNLYEIELIPGSEKFINESETIFLSYEDTNLSSDYTPFITEKTRKKINKKILDIEQISDELDSYNQEDNKDSKMSKKQMYMVCWKVFNECYNAYREDYNDLYKDSEKINQLYQETLNSDYLQSHPVIARGSFDINKISGDELMSVGDRPQSWLLYSRDKDTTLDNLGFMTSSRIIFDPILWHHSAALFQESETRSKITPAFQNKTPNYNISDRPLKKLNEDEVTIIEPTAPPQLPKQNILSIVLPTLLSVVVLFAIRIIFNNGLSNFSMMIMTAAMSVTSLIIGLVNRAIQKKDNEIAVKEWKSQYESYITRTINQIVERQKKDVENLQMMYPPALLLKNGINSTHSIVNKILTVNGDIYNRGKNHPDFLTIRLGTSLEGSHLVESVFKVIGQKKDAIYTSIMYKNILHKDKLPFKIVMDKKNPGMNDGSYGYLIDLPSDISKCYKYLDNAPVLLNVEKCASLGLVYGDYKKSCKPFIDNVILDLCFNHSPEDLQIVMFFDEDDDSFEQHNKIRNYKHLPHFHELLGDISAFVFNENDAHSVFDKLTELIEERKNLSDDIRLPHVLVIFQEQYGLKNHLFSQYLPEYSEDGVIKTEGVSFVFCTEYTEQLPKYCGHVIHFKNEKKYYLLPHTIQVQNNKEKKAMANKNKSDLDSYNESISQYCFIPDKILSEEKYGQNKESLDEYYRAYKTLSALHYERIAQSANMPNNITLFEMLKHSLSKEDSLKDNTNDKFEAIKLNLEEYDDEAKEVQLTNNKKNSKEKIRKEVNEYLYQQYGYNEKTKQFKTVRSVKNSLAVPIGEKSQDAKDHGIVHLDLHEKGDGPHMLVAGTTGSGKTETVLTYLLNLCSLYTPQQVTLLLMDMKGEDFVRRIGNLPHVVGKVTDVDGDKVGNSTAYMLKRFLLSMNAEIKRRKMLLSKMGVNNISNYIEAKSNLKEHMLNNHIDKSREKELEDLEDMPHLFLVIDEFTELMQFTSENSDVDFKSSITSLARVGRSLGFHIILISQNIENSITPDIRVNSRARLCLRVATRDASKEMIGTDLAASPQMPGNGRAYLHVGNGSRFEYFQSAYSGADILGDLSEPVMLTFAKPTGKYTRFYDSKIQKEIDERRNTNVQDEMNLQKKNNSQSGITQIQFVSERICEFWNEIWKEENPVIKKPHMVFAAPLPTHCWYDWEEKKYIDISDIMKKKEEQK